MSFLSSGKSPRKALGDVTNHQGNVRRSFHSRGMIPFLFDEVHYSDSCLLFVQCYGPSILLQLMQSPNLLPLIKDQLLHVVIVLQDLLCLLIQQSRFFFFFLFKFMLLSLYSSVLKIIVLFARPTFIVQALECFHLKTQIVISLKFLAIFQMRSPQRLHIMSTSYPTPLYKFAGNAHVSASSHEPSSRMFSSENTHRKFLNMCVHV